MVLVLKVCMHAFLRYAHNQQLLEGRESGELGKKDEGVKKKTFTDRQEHEITGGKGSGGREERTIWNKW